MRDLEQAKAEVFRRSDARIKKRKAIRRSVIACCVPLVLCMGFWSVMILPAMMPAKSAAPESAVMNSMNGLTIESAQDSVSFGAASPKFQFSSTPDAVILVHGEEYPLSDEDAKVIRGILKDLNYNPYRVCRCLPQYQFEFKSKSYGLHLGEGYARCEEGQARLTAEQLQAIREIFSRNHIEFNQKGG